MPIPAPTSITNPSSPARFAKEPGLWLIVVLAALLFFARFHSPLQEPQEARYAEIPRQMLETRSFLVPLLRGQSYLDKPPLFYWLVIASYSVFGIHDWSARLAACGVAFLCVLATYAWGRRLAGPRAAFLGALMLCLAPRFLQLERMVTMDGLLCLCVIGAWGAGQAALAADRPRLGCWLLSALACGFGLLTKGPVALVLVLPLLLVNRWLDPRLARPRWSWYGFYIAVAAGLAAPWYVALEIRDPHFLEYFFWVHHVQRFVEPFDHAQPFWFYLPVLLAGMLPWTLLLPGAVAFVARQGRSEKAKPIVICLAAGGWCLLFFTLAGCKRASYLLPAFPAFALALGCYLDAIVPTGTTLRHSWVELLRHRSVLGCIAAIGVFAVGLVAAITAVESDWMGNLPALTWAAILGVGLIVSLVYAWLAHGRGSWAVCAASTFVLMAGAVYEAGPAYCRHYSLRGLVRRHAAEYGRSTVPVICYPRHWDSVGFYLERTDVRAYAANELPALLADLEENSEVLLFVKNGPAGASPSDELLARLRSSLVFEPLGRQGMLTVGRVVPRCNAPRARYANKTKKPEAPASNKSRASRADD